MERRDEAPEEGYQPKFLYLDQNFWGRLALHEHRDFVERLERMVQDGQWVIPLSIVQFMETMKARPDIRGPLRALFMKLSTCSLPSNPLDVIKSEHENQKRGRDLSWMRRVMTAGDAFSINWNFLLHGVLADVPNGPFKDAIDTPLQEGAPKATEVTRRGETAYKKDELSQVLGIPFDEMPSEDPAEWMDVFPSLAVRELMQATIVARVPHGLEPNDLADLVSLAMVLPYFDVVATDRKMGARVREAKIDHFLRATVVTTMEDLAKVLGGED